MRTLRVALSERAYDIHIGHNLLGRAFHCLVRGACHGSSTCRPFDFKGLELIPGNQIGDRHRR
jgi:hypothetical protein